MNIALLQLELPILPAKMPSPAATPIYLDWPLQHVAGACRIPAPQPAGRNHRPEHDRRGAWRRNA